MDPRELDAVASVDLLRHVPRGDADLLRKCVVYLHALGRPLNEQCRHWVG